MPHETTSLKAWNNEYKFKKNVWRTRYSGLFPKGTFTGKKVLELGVGNGKTLIKILLQNPASVKAIDFSLAALHICKEKFAKHENTEFIEARLEELPFADSEFDVVVCFHSMAHIPQSDREKAASEIKRVLKGNGTLLFEDFAVGDMRFGKGKETEKNTFIRGNGITTHYFTTSEVKELFGMKGTIEETENKLFLAGKEVIRKEVKAELRK